MNSGNLKQKPRIYTKLQ